MRRPVAAVLARPKSRIFKVQSDFTTMLLGFRSCPDKQHKPDLEEEGAQHDGLCEGSAPRSPENSIIKFLNFTDSAC